MEIRVSSFGLMCSYVLDMSFYVLSGFRVTPMKWVNSPPKVSGKRHLPGLQRGLDTQWLAIGTSGSLLGGYIAVVEVIWFSNPFYHPVLSLDIFYTT